MCKNIQLRSPGGYKIETLQSVVNTLPTQTLAFFLKQGYFGLNLVITEKGFKLHTLPHLYCSVIFRFVSGIKHMTTLR